MTETTRRLTPEQLDQWRSLFEHGPIATPEIVAGLRQAVHDARVLQQLRAWLESEKRGDWMLDISPAMVQRVLAKLTELETDR